MMKWNGKTKERYEAKGYRWTKSGDEFEIKVEDLSCGSHALVEVKCDCINCTNPITKPVKWQDYLKCVKADGKYYCQKCAHVLYGGENTRKGHLKNSKSFEKWCIENNRQDVLDRWDYELNSHKPSEVNYSSSNSYWFKCPRGLHESELKDLNRFTSGYYGTIDCKTCNSFAQWGIDNLGDDFLDKYWSNKNTVNPWKTPSGWNNKVYVLCQEKDYHGSYEITCNGFTTGGRCSYCGNFKVHPLDSLGTLYPKSMELWSNRNDNLSYDYNPFSTKKVYWKCECGKHEDYPRDIASSVIYKFRCPKCVQERNESFLQEKVRLYLESLNNGEYTILHEYDTLKCINPKTKMTLPYDNEVKELKLIIEVHGRQHYIKLNGSWHKTDYDLYKRKLYDRYKRVYAKSQEYNYLEIPYWTDDKDKTWKKLIDDKISEILIKDTKENI
jgi:hypothetical protein